MARALVKTSIRGFDDDVLRGGIPEGHVVLLRGASGTMKSSIAYYVLYHNALPGAPRPVRAPRAGRREPPRARRHAGPARDGRVGGPPDPRREPRAGPSGGGRGPDGPGGPRGRTRRGPPRGPQGEDPRAPPEARLPPPRDRLVGRDGARPRVRGPPRGDVRVLRVAPGPRGHELPRLRGAPARAAGRRPRGGVPRGRDHPPRDGPRHADDVPAARPVREDAQRGPGHGLPDPPVRERSVRALPGHGVTRCGPASWTASCVPSSCSSYRSSSSRASTSMGSSTRSGCTRSSSWAGSSRC